MGYKGKTQIIDCSRGGLIGGKNIDFLEPFDMLPSSKNIELSIDGREKRKGTAYVNAFTFGGTSTALQIMGGVDFWLRSGTHKIPVALNNGIIYDGDDGTSTIASGMSTVNYYSMNVFDDQLFICDGENTPQIWDGTSTTTNIANSPTDWATHKPSFMVPHGRGVSRRMWAFQAGSIPQRVYASENGTGQDFSDANVITIDIETGDGFGIVAAIEFGDRLLCFGKKNTFIIDDESGTAAEWGYQKAQWDGGAANFRLVCATPNDIVAMTEDGEIYSIRSAEQYGDYKAGSLIRPAFMHQWIKDNLDLSAIKHFHMVYDRSIRAVRIFVRRSGMAYNDTCLLYYIDREPREAWMVHDNDSYDSGFSASCSFLAIASTGDWRIYTGDYDGNTWKLGETNKNDEGNGYYSGWLTPNLHQNRKTPFGNTWDEAPRWSKKYGKSWVVVQPVGNYDINIVPTVDDVVKAGTTVNMLGGGVALGSFILGTDTLGGSELIDEPFEIGEVGKRLQLNLYNGNADENFFVSQLMIDYKPLGKRAS